VGGARTGGSSPSGEPMTDAERKELWDTFHELWGRSKDVDPKYGRELKDAWQRVQRLIERLDPPRGGCGMRYHHATCDCDGNGGER
jgi:hypothetical protein